MRIPKDLPDVAHAKPGPTAVYRLYDARGHLLYVGITNSTHHRFAQHAANKVWWPQVARKNVRWYPTRKQALRQEYVAIRTEAPIHNVMHNQRRGKAAPAESARVPIVLALSGALLLLGSFVGWWEVEPFMRMIAGLTMVVAGVIAKDRLLAR